MESGLDARPSEISLSSSEGCFSVIQNTRQEILKRIDQAYSSDELRTTTFQMTIMRPLRDAVLSHKAPSLFYALLLNRIQFQTEANSDIAVRSVNHTRATICELLAIDLSSNYAKPEQTFHLVRLLTITYSPFMGCSPEHFQDRISEEEMQELTELGDNEPANALEMAVLSESKAFLSTPVIQSILSALYEGTITYLPLARGNAILGDEYKQIGAEIYNPRKRPLLDHYQLRVPRVRAVMESANFGIMLLLFVTFHTTQEHHKVSGWEIAFNVWTAGFALDEFAQHMNGNYFSDVWNALDFTYLLVWFVYLGLRVYGVSLGDRSISMLATDTLATGSVILLPRLVGSIIKRNIVILGVQSMFFAYVRFLFLAFLAASGFLFCFWILADQEKTLLHITWIMMRVWLGGYFLTESEASSYHPVYGPILMVVFALFSNSLLLTVLISILSDTFVKVQANAEQEFLYEKAIKTLERLKGDLLLEYPPPANLIGLLVLAPAKYILSPRALHSLHVFLVRTTSFPVLLTLGAWYRFKEQLDSGSVALSNGSEALLGSLPTQMTLLDGGARTQRLAAKVFERDIAPQDLPDALPSRPQAPIAPASVPRTRSGGVLGSVFSRVLNPVDLPQSAETRLQNLENSVNHIESMLQELLNQVSRNDSNTEDRPT